MPRKILHSRSRGRTIAARTWRSRHVAPSRQRGMTLLETMVVLAIIGLLMGLGYMAVMQVSQASLREETTDVAAVLQAANNMAIMSRKHHRVVFDLEHQAYRIEVCEGDIKLAKSEREGGDEDTILDPSELAKLTAPGSKIPPEMLKSMDQEVAVKMAAALSGKRIPARCSVPQLPNGDADGRGNERKVRSEDGVKIQRIYVEHLEGAQLDGFVTINFFPLGFAEKAVLELEHEDGGEFSVVVHGLTGQVEIDTDDFDAEEYMSRDALGDEVKER